jgi:hypothetical protein
LSFAPSLPGEGDFWEGCEGAHRKFFCDPPQPGGCPKTENAQRATDLFVEALDLRLVRANGRGRLTLAVSNPLGDVQREYRPNGYAEVKSRQTGHHFTRLPGFYPVTKAVPPVKIPNAKGPKALRANVQIPTVQTPKKPQPKKFQRPPELLTIVI